MKIIVRYIAKIDIDLKAEVKEIIQETLQTKDFHMFEPIDGRGNTVEDLFADWLARTIGEVNTRYFADDKNRKPCSELRDTLDMALNDYVSEVYDCFTLPAVFPVTFHIERLDKLNYIVHGDRRHSVFE